MTTYTAKDGQSYLLRADNGVDYYVGKADGQPHPRGLLKVRVLRVRDENGAVHEETTIQGEGGDPGKFSPGWRFHGRYLWAKHEAVWHRRRKHPVVVMPRVEAEKLLADLRVKAMEEKRLRDPALYGSVETT